MDDLLLTAEPFLTDPKHVAAWLESVGVRERNYEINVVGLVDVDVHVDLEGKLGSLKRLPVRFGRVTGFFNCRNNLLVSLEGTPEEVGGDFDCNDNRLVSLEGAPKKVGGYFRCANNQLVSLEGAPKKVGGDFDCYNNQLVNLEGAPKKVGGYFDCNNNQLVSLEGAPKKVGGYFRCENNQLVSLEGAPKKVRNGFSCGNNQLVSLEGAPKKVGWNFWCDHNLLVDLKGLEGTSIRGGLFVTDPKVAGQDNVFVSLDGLPKELYRHVMGLDITALLAVEAQHSGIPDMEI